MRKEYVLCAAIHFLDDKKYTHQPKNVSSGFVICGRRHHNCFTTVFEQKINYNKAKCIQGFITSHDNFVNREEAAKIAFEAKQTNEMVEVLVSEDLY
jgi:UDP-3-O-[3-hydroxymyristoyl] glucosamine N-acyltransferase